MSKLLKLFSQVLLLFLVVLSIKRVHGDINYKLTSFVGRYVSNVTSWVNRRQVVIDYGVGWCNDSLGWLFDLDLNKTWTDGSVPLISWQPILCHEVHLPGVIKLIMNGTLDEYINQFSNHLKKWLSGPDGIYGNDDDRRSYLRLGK